MINKESSIENLKYRENDKERENECARERERESVCVCVFACSCVCLHGMFNTKFKTKVLLLSRNKSKEAVHVWLVSVFMV